MAATLEWPVSVPAATPLALRSKTHPKFVVRDAMNHDDLIQAVPAAGSAAVILDPASPVAAQQPKVFNLVAQTYGAPAAPAPAAPAAVAPPALAAAATETKALRAAGAKRKRPAQRLARAWVRLFRFRKHRKQPAEGPRPVAASARKLSAGPDEAAAAPRLRWAVRTTAWSPSPAEFELLLSLLAPEQQAAVTRLRVVEDRKRALVSRLLARAAAAASLGLAPGGVQMARTRGGKPYVTGAFKPASAPNWNFSVSHEGDFVILASEPVAVCGCDVAAARGPPRRGPAEPLHAFFAAFEDSFTRREWQTIYGAGLSEAKQEAAFRKLWSLKEAFVKATGEGLSFDLGLLEFEITGSTAKVSVCGEPVDGWAFHLHDLGNSHWVSTARAPLSAVVDSWGGFKATFQRTSFDASEWAKELSAPEPAFALLSVADLLAHHERAELAASLSA